MLCGIDLSCASARQSHSIRESLVGSRRTSTTITFVIDRWGCEGILLQGDTRSCPYTLTFTHIVSFIVSHIVHVVFYYVVAYAIDNALFPQTVQVTSTPIDTEGSQTQS